MPLRGVRVAGVLERELVHGGLEVDGPELVVAVLRGRSRRGDVRLDVRLERHLVGRHEGGGDGALGGRGVRRGVREDDGTAVHERLGRPRRVEDALAQAHGVWPCAQWAGCGGGIVGLG